MKHITVCFFDTNAVYTPFDGPLVAVDTWQGESLVRTINACYPEAKFTARVVVGYNRDTCWTEYMWEVEA